MKKPFILTLLLLLFTSTNVSASTNVHYDYTKYAENSEYERIEKISGIWYGVIEVTASEVTWLDDAGFAYGGFNTILIKYSRELENLNEITIKYTTKDYCFGPEVVGICIGTTTESYTETETIYNKQDDGSFLEYLTLDKITTTANANYDYAIFIKGEPIDIVEIISFKYVLTDAEIDLLRLDIQEQYEQELNLILNNAVLTDEERSDLINQLNQEYAAYQIDYGEEMESYCVGDGCIAEAEDDTPAWAKALADKALKAITYVFGILLGGAALAMIISNLTGRIVDTATDMTTSVAKSAIKAGAWWGTQFANGILFILKPLLKGLTRYPILTVIILSIAALLFILL
jgi:hypothetical protein